MTLHRAIGKSRASPRAGPPQYLLSVIEAVKGERLFIGGKSMGGRIASLIADEAQVAGLVCLGYPFHPTAKPERGNTDMTRFISSAGGPVGFSVDFRHAWGINPWFHGVEY